MAKKETSKTVPTAMESELAGVEKKFQKEMTILKARPIIMKALLYLWIVLDTVLLILFLVVVVYYLVAGSFTERRAVAGLEDNLESIHSVTIARSATDILLGDTSVFSVGESEFDFYAEIENTNTDWYATFSYQFITNRGDTEEFVGFIMPGQRKPLIAFRQELPSRPSTTDLAISNVVWSRVNGHDIADINTWLNEHNQFELTDAVFARNVELEGSSLARSSFTIANNSPYSYWSADFYIFLERSGTILGVNQVTLPGFASGESRDLDINWFGAAPATATVNVIPNINYFDTGAYMSPEGDLEIDIRDRY
ncbi:MAG: hypothetical protein ABH846_01660 [Patescibacteria group bacterium]